MSTPNANPANGTHPAAPAPTTTDATTAGAVVSTHATAEEITGATRINSMADLKRKAPKLYNSMMQGIAMNICNEMQRHQSRLKSLWKEMER